MTRISNDKMKYVFVCGLHRSGTTILAHDIGALNNCTAFVNTGALMDEGQHLQDVYPPDYIYGGVGKFGFAPEAHLTEHSSLLTTPNVSRLRQSWDNYWDRNRTIRIEKTPGNLLMTRFLQAVFPNSYFIVIKRHPVPVSLASQKWSRSSLHSLFEHWLRCHEIFDNDKQHLKNLYELSYEDYVENSECHLKRIANFIGTDLPSSLTAQAADVHNKKYFTQWAYMLQSAPFRSYYRSVAMRFNKQFAEHGYSLVGFGTETASLPRQSAVRGRRIAPLLFLGADAYWVIWNAGLWLKARTRQMAKQYFPAKVQAIIRDCKSTLNRISA